MTSMLTCGVCHQLLTVPVRAARPDLPGVIDPEKQAAVEFRAIGEVLQSHYMHRHMKELQGVMGVALMWCHYLLAVQALSADPRFGELVEAVREQLSNAVRPPAELAAAAESDPEGLSDAA